jgi:hypothetical protein
MEQRYAWFLDFANQTGHPEWFNNILSVLRGFIAAGVGKPDSWISWTDAGTLSSIVDGWHIYKSGTPADPTTQGAAGNWAKFFYRYMNDKSADPNDPNFKHDWATAEKSGNYYGNDLAAENHVFPTAKESAFLWAGNALYRDLMITYTERQFYGGIGRGVGSTICTNGSGPTCGEVGYQLGAAFGDWFTNPALGYPNNGPVYFIVYGTFKILP